MPPHPSRVFLRGRRYLVRVNLSSIAVGLTGISVLSLFRYLHRTPRTEERKLVTQQLPASAEGWPEELPGRQERLPAWPGADRLAVNREGLPPHQPQWPLSNSASGWCGWPEAQQSQRLAVAPGVLGLLPALSCVGRWIDFRFTQRPTSSLVGVW